LRRVIIALALLMLPVLDARSETLVFKGACAKGDQLKIAAVGDLIFHKQLLVQIFNRRRRVESFWSPVRNVFDAADVTYGNLEGPVAPRITAAGRTMRRDIQKIDYRVYGYRLSNLSFNFPPAVLDGLRAGGFDVISTANNHALDRGSIGLDLTIDGLRKRKLTFSGTRKRSARPGNRAAIISRNGFHTAWLACTYSTNGMRDSHGQVTRCYKHKPEILAELKRHADDPTIDAVFLTPHWGQENHYRPSRRQRKFAREAIEAGALAVIGAHPHVVQPWEKHVTANGREGLIVYSTGNFLSNQRQVMQRAGVIVTLVLTRSQQTTRTGDQRLKTQLSAAGYIPTWVEIDGKGHRTIENSGKRKTALKWTQRILPDGNRVPATAPFQLPRPCDYEALTRLSPTLKAGRLSLRSAPPVQSTAIKKAGAQQSRKPSRRADHWKRQVLGSN
jgi:Bacterial capsule synthesis protein PGA_cap